MRFPYKSVACFIIAFFLAGMINGCISYRMLRKSVGEEIGQPGNRFQIGKTTLKDTLLTFGAPDRLVPLEGKFLLIYERSIYHQNSLAFGIPISDAAGSSINISAYGNLTRYDTLALFFNPDNRLYDMVFEVGSSRPFFDTLMENN
jgi:hypothetical protein